MTIPQDVEQQFKTKTEEWATKYPYVKPYYILEYGYTSDGYDYVHRYDATDIRACYTRIQALHPNFKFLQLKVIAKVKYHRDLVTGFNEMTKVLRNHRIPPSTLAFPFSPQTIGLTLQ